MFVFSALVSLLTENLIFTKALGTSTLLAAAKNRSNLAVLSGIMTFFAVLSALCVSLIYRIFPQLCGMAVMPLGMFRPLLYTIVISVIYLAVLLLLSLTKQFAKIRKYIHLAAFNCAVMGSLYLGFPSEQILRSAVVPADFLGIYVSADPTSPLAAVCFGLEMGLGFLLSSLLLIAVRKRLYSEEVPAAFRGFPAVLVYIGLLSLAVFAIGVQ